MVMMRVGEKNRLRLRRVIQQAQVRQRQQAFPLRVHAAVQDYRPPRQGQGVAICPDLHMARKVQKLHGLFLLFNVTILLGGVLLL